MSYPRISQLRTWPFYTYNGGNFGTKPSDSFQNFEGRKVVDTKGSVICQEKIKLGDCPRLGQPYLNQQTDVLHDQTSGKRCAKECLRISGE